MGKRLKNLRSFFAFISLLATVIPVWADGASPTSNEAASVSAAEKAKDAGIRRLPAGGQALADTEATTCEFIKSLYVSGHAKKYSIPFDQPDPDQLIYHFSINHTGDSDVIVADCGNGSDAVCEMTLTINGRKAFDFVLATTIRFLDINGKIYIVNGVSENANGKVSFGRYRDYEVHQLFTDRLKIICPTH